MEKKFDDSPSKYWKTSLCQPSIIILLKILKKLTGHSSLANFPHTNVSIGSSNTCNTDADNDVANLLIDFLNTCDTDSGARQQQQHTNALTVRQMYTKSMAVPDNNTIDQIGRSVTMKLQMFYSVLRSHAIRIRMLGNNNIQIL